jgi:hypothetical protein
MQAEVKRIDFETGGTVQNPPPMLFSFENYLLYFAVTLL